MRQNLIFLSLFVFVTTTAFSGNPIDGSEPVNLVVIFVDDLGYADIGPFGATNYPTPNLDRMAREGMKFTDFVTCLPFVLLRELLC